MRIKSAFQVDKPGNRGSGLVYEADMDGFSTFFVTFNAGQTLGAVAIASASPAFIPQTVPLNEHWDLAGPVYPQAFLELVRTDDLVKEGIARKNLMSSLTVKSDGRILIRAFDIGGMARAAWIDLQSDTLSRDDGAGEEVYVTRWRLWASQEEYERPDGRPLAEVVAAPRPAR